MRRDWHEKHKLPQRPPDNVEELSARSDFLLADHHCARRESEKRFPTEKPRVGTEIQIKAGKKKRPLSESLLNPPKTTMGACDDNLVGPEDPRGDEPPRGTTVGVDVLVISGWYQATPDDVSASTAT